MKRLFQWLGGEVAWTVAVLVFVGIGLVATMAVAWLFELSTEATGAIGLVFGGIALWLGLDFAKELKS